MKINKRKVSFYLILVLAIIAAGYYYWSQNSSSLPEGFAQSNGRIEATEIDIATKTAGRIDTILVKEGDFVQQGQELARMDTRALQEQLHEVQAQLRQAISAVATAESGLVQRKSEKLAAQAVVRQREAELDAAQKRLNRSRVLVKTKAVSQQQVDDDTAQMQGAKAALEASKAQVAASTAAIDSAQAGIVQAKNRVEAATATERRITADLEDSILKAPRNGRIQYRVAEPGEVLGAGGRVLNMVDLSDVYMTFFLPTEQAGKVALGSEVHIILDAAPNIVIPAKTSFVASVAQFTPKTVETQNERLKLMFRVRARISPELLEKHLEYVKTGLPGKAYVRLDAQAAWPTDLEVRLPQ
ncbi:HlyD family efflux transporter periplasmic adaptor subunit [Providencia sp. PROV188]|jgi:HlyD family secretion protein|uniref:HlyD family secretion protein n=1 Tax=Providencia TaxID=586 RepID=UPI000D3BAA12|nr:MULTISPECIES: HlyD family efflux transporter periplasmic adaptor subunit [Providencia]MBG5882079.1 HlyD family efflux transporter periplasmic adaptor subunit [Providencia alcalifaciens]MDR2243611.1 HlyD family efflux transporter periplasmic adaptor subunit [Providencia alcalifaciens]MDR2988861.1 HlyD family efflux transporter periplasmic adaptor subunit [Providencia alcalifaciens]MTB46205.1 HlyD family efflux transporter periplasmic adaptor subunit [Providencia sp. wls1950]MTC45170.1 HlyD f